MPTEKNNPQLGVLIIELMEQRAWSMGALSSLTGIDKATISRIVNGKRKANLQHLQKFSHAFEVPIQSFMVADGYEMQTSCEKQEADLQASLVNLQHLLDISGAPTKVISKEEIEEELRKYSRIVETKEGQDIILGGFEEKLKSTGSIGPHIDRLKQLYLKYRMKKSSPKELALMGSALIYFILPLDLIPDYFFAIGYLDDAIAVQLVMNLLSIKE